MPELLLSEPPHPARAATARMVPAVAAALVRMTSPLSSREVVVCPVTYPPGTIARRQDGFVAVSRRKGPETRRGPRCGPLRSIGTTRTPSARGVDGLEGPSRSPVEGLYRM